MLQSATASDYPAAHSYRKRGNISDFFGYSSLNKQSFRSRIKNYEMIGAPNDSGDDDWKARLFLTFLKGNAAQHWSNLDSHLQADWDFVVEGLSDLVHNKFLANAYCAAFFENWRHSWGMPRIVISPAEVKLLAFPSETDTVREKLLKDKFTNGLWRKVRRTVLFGVLKTF